MTWRARAVKNKTLEPGGSSFLVGCVKLPLAPLLVLCHALTANAARADAHLLRGEGGMEGGEQESAPGRAGGGQARRGCKARRKEEVQDTTVQRAASPFLKAHQSSRMRTLAYGLSGVAKMLEPFLPEPSPPRFFALLRCAANVGRQKKKNKKKQKTGEARRSAARLHGAWTLAPAPPSGRTLLANDFHLLLEDSISFSTLASLALRLASFRFRSSRSFCGRDADISQAGGRAGVGWRVADGRHGATVGPAATDLRLCLFLRRLCRGGVGGLRGRRTLLFLAVGRPQR